MSNRGVSILDLGPAALAQVKDQFAGAQIPAAPKKPKNAEELFHRSVAQFLALALPDDAFCTAFPAGGGGPVRGGVLKAMGLKAGMGDHIVIWNSRILVMEFKTPHGRVAKEQHECHAHLRRGGAIVHICRSIEDVCAALRDLGVPLRFTTSR